MKAEVEGLLQALEKWVGAMGAAFKLAEHPKELAANFNNLLKVMDALLQVKTKKLETDLNIDQLYEVLGALKAAGVRRSAVTWY